MVWTWLRYYCSWVGMSGHGYDILVHAWAWVGIGHVCVGMGGHGCNLKGKCRALPTTALARQLELDLKVVCGNPSINRSLCGQYILSASFKRNKQEVEFQMWERFTCFHPLVIACCVCEEWRKSPWHSTKGWDNTSIIWMAMQNPRRQKSP